MYIFLPGWEFESPLESLFFVFFSFSHFMSDLFSSITNISTKFLVPQITNKIKPNNGIFFYIRLTFHKKQLFRLSHELYRVSTNWLLARPDSSKKLIE